MSENKNAKAIKTDSAEGKNEKKNKGKKNIHAGHRQRVYDAISKDPLMETFSEVETLEFLLYSMYPRRDTNALAHLLLERFGSMVGIFSASADDLMKLSGISQRTAMFLKSFPAIARKSQLLRVKSKSIKDMNSALDYIKLHFDYCYTEVMYVMCLDVKNRLLGVDCVTAKGTPTSNVISVPAIVESALHHHASKVILAHNHPTGIVIPSIEDINTTDLLIDTLAALDVVLVDHLIFTGDSQYLSFFNSGLIRMLYQNFDCIHKTNMSSFLFVEKERKLSSGIEYIFDMETATIVKKSEFDAYVTGRIERGKVRESGLEELKSMLQQNIDEVKSSLKK